MNAPRGIRNRNPLNLVYLPPVQWQGLDDPPSDGRMCRFVSDQMGIRAAALQVRTYRTRYRLQSISEIVNRWAPPTENNSRAYAKTVADYLGQSVNYAPNVDDADELERLLRGMSIVENGHGPLDGEWYPDLVWQQGVRLAVRPLAKTRTMIGSAATGAAALGQALLDSTQQTVPQAADAASSVGWVFPELSKWVFLAVMTVGIGTVVYARLNDRAEGRT